ncbi:hypothetical protein EYF80_047731 [Liparis tanakae]|uniref:Uncharacterized protein n=1 Tax=Liparis tanakae TaxID=230148 RepID=A0A4Z2FLK1_9TELE|nr:hypothetical protein EYF80_047731 [Liparis tanakae]
MMSRMRGCDVVMVTALCLLPAEAAHPVLPHRGADRVPEEERRQREEDAGARRRGQDRQEAGAVRSRPAGLHAGRPVGGSGAGGPGESHRARLLQEEPVRGRRGPEPHRRHAL